MRPEAANSVASCRYFDREIGRAAIKLLPSQYYVTGAETAMVTVLGSCVAACLHDPYVQVAGMNHFMLPDIGEGGPERPDAMRYGTHAMAVLVRELQAAGARRDRLQAKVFGGAAVLPNMSSLNIGERNAEFVLRYLRREGISVQAQDLGGTRARRVAFLPESGKVVVRRLRDQTELEPLVGLDPDVLQRNAHAAMRTGTA